MNEREREVEGSGRGTGKKEMGGPSFPFSPSPFSPSPFSSPPMHPTHPCASHSTRLANSTRAGFMAWSGAACPDGSHQSWPEAAANLATSIGSAVEVLLCARERREEKWGAVSVMNPTTGRLGASSPPSLQAATHSAGVGPRRRLDGGACEADDDAIQRWLSEWANAGAAQGEVVAVTDARTWRTSKATGRRMVL